MHFMPLSVMEVIRQVVGIIIAIGIGIGIVGIGCIEFIAAFMVVLIGYNWWC